MPTRPNWAKSKAKDHVCALFETGKLNPFHLPNLDHLRDSEPALFGPFPSRNFRQNIRNLAKKYKEKLPHLEHQQKIGEMDSQFRSK